MPSSLELLQNQPIRFGYTAETCANNDDRDYCNLVQDGDYVEIELRRTLGSSLGCGLDDIASASTVLNGTFTGSATGWTLGGGWSYASNKISITASTGTATGQILGVVAGGIYKVVVTTAATTTGDDLDVTLDGTLIGYIPVGSVAGAYIFYGLGGSGSIDISGTSITTSVDSVEAYRVSSCLEFTVSDGTITFSELGELIVNGSVSITATLPFETSPVYSIQTEILFAEVESGELTAVYGADVLSSRSINNGTMTWTLNDSGYTTLGIGLSDFVGKIRTISFTQLSSNYLFTLNDLDGNFVASLSTYNTTYHGEYIWIKFSPQEQGFSYGCYKIGVYDPYLHTDDWLEYYYDFTTMGSPWTESGGTWSLSAAGYAYDSAIANGDAYTIEAVPSSFEMAWGNLYFTTGTLSGPGVGTLSMGATLNSPPTDVLMGVGATASSNTTYRQAIEGSPAVTFASLVNQVRPTIFITGSVVGSDHVEFTEAYYKVYPYHLDYLSNCINYKAVHDCTKLIHAQPGQNLGFDSTFGFALVQRFRVVKIIPNYDIKASDFIGSDSTRTLISGTGQKAYTLLFDYMGELAHDTVFSFVMSKIVYIGDSYADIFNTGKRYFIIPQNYQPEWDKDGKYNLAMGRIQIIEYDQIKFTTNCGN